MKTRNIFLILYALIIVFTLTSLFLYTKIYNIRWISSLIFFILALGFNLYSILFLHKKNINLVIINIPYLISSGFYLFLVFILNIFGEWLPNILQIKYYLSIKNFLFIHFLLLTFTLGILLISYYSNNFIEKIEEETSNKGNEMKLKKFIFDTGISFLPEEVEKALLILEEELKFSDPISYPEVFFLDKKIDFELTALKNLLINFRNEESLKKINYILYLVKKRGDLLLLAK